MNAHWKMLSPEPAIVEKLSHAIPCHQVTAEVLVNRGYNDPRKVSDYLHPSLSKLTPPFELKDMDTAVYRITHALNENEKILIYGDYDADGVTATTTLYHFLKGVNANVSTYLPHRVNDGYGLSSAFIKEQAIASGINLIITVDNGSASHEAVLRANQENIDVIVVDHHIIDPPYPEACAIINPKRPDCNAGQDDLAGVGVVFYLVVCLRKHLRALGFWRGKQEPNLKESCDLVALGTIADMVPLRGDNRILARAGLNIIKKGSARPGITALLSAAGIEPAGIGSEDIAYRLAPRLNAAGRMDHAKSAFSLLAAEDSDNAAQLARRIEALNDQRRKAQQDLTDRIQAKLTENPILRTGAAIVLWGESWHEGILGVVAARLMNHYHRPVVLISTQNGMGKGSARSIPGFDIYRGLSECEDLLVGFGGHAAAAGISINANQLPLFRDRFEAIAAKSLKEKPFVSQLVIDTEISLSDISPRLLDELALLAPFGSHNPVPLFLARNVEVIRHRILGKNHLSMQLVQSRSFDRKVIRAIQFNVGPNPRLPKHIDEMAFSLSWNFWNKSKHPQMNVEATSY